MKYRIFTYSGDALPIAHKLQQEGCEVVIGMVQDKAAIHSAKEGELRPEKMPRLRGADWHCLTDWLRSARLIF